MQYIPTDSNTIIGRKVQRTVDLAMEFYQEMNEARDMMIQMHLPNDGSQAEHFTDVKVHSGAPSDAAAKAMFDELNSLWGVIDGVKATLLQAHAKLGR